MSRRTPGNPYSNAEVGTAPERNCYTLLRIPLVHTAAVAGAALRLLHCQSNWAELMTRRYQRLRPFGTISVGRTRGQSNSSLVVDAAAALAATATAAVSAAASTVAARLMPLLLPLRGTAVPVLSTIRVRAGQSPL